MTVSAAEGYLIPDEAGFAVEGYEYNIQYRWLEPGDWVKDPEEWIWNCTNKFSYDSWYPSLNSVKNALAQMKSSRYGYNRSHHREFRIVRRPYGEVEVL